MFLLDLFMTDTKHRLKLGYEYDYAAMIDNFEDNAFDSSYVGASNHRLIDSFRKRNKVVVDVYNGLGRLKAHSFRTGFIAFFQVVFVLLGICFLLFVAPSLHTNTINSVQGKALMENSSVIEDVSKTEGVDQIITVKDSEGANVTVNNYYSIYLGSEEDK